MRRAPAVLAFVSILLGLSAGGVAAGSPVFAAVIAVPRLTLILPTGDVPLGAAAPVTFRVTNVNSSLALEGVGVTISLPAGLKSPTGSGGAYCGGGAMTMSAHKLVLTGGHVPADTECTVSVLVDTVQAGTWTVTTTRVQSSNAGIGNSATGTVKVKGPATPPPAAPTPTAQPTPSASASPSSDASPSDTATASPTAFTEASASADPSDPPATSDPPAGGDPGSGIPLPLILLVAAVVAAIGLGLAGALFVRRRRSAA